MGTYLLLCMHEGMMHYGKRDMDGQDRQARGFFAVGMIAFPTGLWCAKRVGICSFRLLIEFSCNLHSRHDQQHFYESKDDSKE